MALSMAVMSEAFSVPVRVEFFFVWIRTRSKARTTAAASAIDGGLGRTDDGAGAVGGLQSSDVGGIRCTSSEGAVEVGWIGIKVFKACSISA